jgi:hypothetical protein
MPNFVKVRLVDHYYDFTITRSCNEFGLMNVSELLSHTSPEVNDQHNALCLVLRVHIHLLI